MAKLTPDEAEMLSLDAEEFLSAWNGSPRRTTCIVGKRVFVLEISEVTDPTEVANAIARRKAAVERWWARRRRKAKP